MQALGNKASIHALYFVTLEHDLQGKFAEGSGLSALI